MRPETIQSVHVYRTKTPSVAGHGHTCGRLGAGRQHEHQLIFEAQLAIELAMALSSLLDAWDHLDRERSRRYESEHALGCLGAFHRMLDVRWDFRV